MNKEERETVTISNKVSKVKKKLPTKPNNRLKELIEFQNLLSGFKFRLTEFKILLSEFELNKEKQETFAKVKALLPIKIQKIIASTYNNPIDELGNYFILAETLIKLRECAEYLQSQTGLLYWRNEELQSYSAEQRKKFIENNKKFDLWRAPSHEMFHIRFTQFNEYSDIRMLNTPEFPSRPVFYSFYTEDGLWDSAFELAYESTYLMRVLKGIDARRLRICGNKKCPKVFWAYRLNQEFCDKDCQNRVKRRRFYHLNK